MRDTARGYAQDKLFPRVLMDNREERFDRAIVREMGALGLLGPTMPEEYGGRGARLRRLWADHARDRAGRFRLPLRHVGAVVAGHASRSSPSAARRSAENICPSSRPARSSAASG